MYTVHSLSHTADVGFEVTADSLGELFRGAADGLVRVVLAGPDDPGETRGATDLTALPGPDDGEEPEVLALERPDRERLMVAWLRELLFRITDRGRFPGRVTVAMTGPAALRAKVRWSNAARAGGPAREVKGITYHGLRVARDGDGGWRARLVLDV